MPRESLERLIILFTWERSNRCLKTLHHQYFLEVANLIFIFNDYSIIHATNT